MSNRNARLLFVCAFQPSSRCFCLLLVWMGHTLADGNNLHQHHGVLTLYKHCNTALAVHCTATLDCSKSASQRVLTLHQHHNAILLYTSCAHCFFTIALQRVWDCTRSSNMKFTEIRLPTVAGGRSDVSRRGSRMQPVCTQVRTCRAFLLD
jgi:hypothetical protein